jgi:hypothetical protein
MKTKLLLLYGYLLPLVGSVIMSCLPWFFDYAYNNIADYYSQNLELLLAFLAVVVTATYPFQTAILSEDNPHVLNVLEKSKVRDVFVRASVFQAILIVCATLLILFLSANPVPTASIGFIELLASTMIAFEAIALISNGRAYGNIREKIITEVNRAEQKKHDLHDEEL